MQKFIVLVFWFVAFNAMAKSSIDEHNVLLKNGVYTPGFVDISSKYQTLIKTSISDVRAGYQVFRFEDMLSVALGGKHTGMAKLDGSKLAMTMSYGGPSLDFILFPAAPIQLSYGYARSGGRFMVSEPGRPTSISKLNSVEHAFSSFFEVSEHTRLFFSATLERVNIRKSESFDRLLQDLYKAKQENLADMRLKKSKTFSLSIGVRLTRI